MQIIGINETYHDAGVALIKDGSILFAGHAERYSKVKNDSYNNPDILADLFHYGYPDCVAYYEKPWLKKARVKMLGGIPSSSPFFQNTLLNNLNRKNFSHHYTHAAAGYYTSPFKDAAIVVLDAIGEFTTSSIWVGEDEQILPIKKWRYPFSFGLFYSAFTHLVGLKPNQEEYTMMGMAAYGDSSIYYKKVSEYFPNSHSQKYNFHKGILDWRQPITDEDRFHIAAAAQKVYENRLQEFMVMVADKTKKTNLVFMGGCALNSKANTLLWNIFDDIWIMPNPGDAGSSLGAAAALYGKHLNWQGPYLGYDLENEYPVDRIFEELINNKVCAVAAGRAEFGPRALGNRSILADPRDPSIKDRINLIKQRELFRPFAPVIMEEHASEWFEMDYTSPYMQYTPRCLKPDLIPSVVHVDGTSRVQTVNAKQHPGLYAVLKKFYEKTGVPALLNTSLNIKGQPLLNDHQDIKLWEEQYKTKIIY
jgi:carbamoyltransferase